MKDRRGLRVASVQMEHTDGDKQANFAKIEKFTAAGGRAECATGRVPRMLRDRLLVHPQPFDTAVGRTG